MPVYGKAIDCGLLSFQEEGARQATSRAKRKREKKKEESGKRALYVIVNSVPAHSLQQFTCCCSKL